MEAPVWATEGKILRRTVIFMTKVCKPEAILGMALLRLQAKNYCDPVLPKHDAGGKLDAEWKRARGNSPASAAKNSADKGGGTSWAHRQR
jgi:hypothetical protein